MSGSGRGGQRRGDPEGAPPQDNGPIRTHRTFYPPFHHQRRRRCCAATLASSALRRVYFSPLRSHQGGFPLPSPSAAVPLSPRTAARRSAIVGVGKGFVEGALGAGVCAVRNFYADDGAVCRGSISEQHPLDFQGFRIDSNSAPRRNFTPFLVRDILVPACPARNIASVAPTFSSFSYSLPRHCPSIGVNHRCVDGNQW